jgi:hypothetical protein
VDPPVVGSCKYVNCALSRDDDREILRELIKLATVIDWNISILGKG